MSVSNRKQSRSSGLSRNRKQNAATKSRRPQARKAFFEALEGRAMMAIDVAVIGGSGDTSGFLATVNQLNDDTFYDFNATLLTESQADTLAELSAYDVVVIGNSGAGGINYAAFQSALRSFVEGGGGVVSTGYLVDWTSEAGEPDLAAIVPVNLNNTLLAGGPSTITINATAHPVTAGVSTFSTNSLFVEGSAVGPDAGSTTLATTNYTAPLAFSSSVVVDDIGAGRSVYLGAPYNADTVSYTNADLRTGMADRLLEQAAAWAAGVTSAVTGTLSPALDGSGNLALTDTDATGKDNSLSISNNGAGAIVITDAVEAFASTGGIAGATLSNGNKTLTVPVASITGTQIIVNGMAGKDTLTANVANALGKILTFNGGAPVASPGDKLVVTGGTHATGTLNHTNASDGSVVLGASTINYTGLEPVDITGTTITDLVINLPDVAGTPDDTELSLTGGGTTLTVTSLVAAHELDNIALAAFTTVTVNARAGDDTIRLATSMETFNKALTLNGGAGADNFIFAVSVAAPGTITVNGGTGIDTLNYSGYKVAAADTAVDVNLTATAANGFSGNVKVGASTITAFTEIDSVTGNSTTTTDSLTGLNASATWTVDEVGGSKYVSTGTLNFAKFENLNGGTAADKYVVTNPAAVAFSLAGGAGSDTLDVSGLAGTTVTITNDNVTAGFDGNVGATSFTGVDSFLGAAGSTLVGDDADSTWTINDGGTSTYATAARTANVAGFNKLQGGSAKDTFNVVSNSATANYSLKGGGDVDAFNFGNANSLVNLTNPISVDGEAAGATLTLNDQGTAAAINYSIAATTIGRTGGGTVTFGNITDVTLNATNGSNKLSVTAVPTVTGTKSLNGGTGSDTLDLTGFGVSAVTITGDNVTGGFDGNFSGVNFTSVDSFQGAAGSTLTGDDVDSTWTVNDGGTSSYATAARLASFTGFNNLQGGTGKDTFNVVNNSATGNYSLKGGAGVDAFNFGNANSLANITNPISVDGEAAGATLTLNDQGTAVNINYSIAATTIGRTGGGTVTFGNITDLTLNATNGTNKLSVTAAPTATGTKTLNGGTGADTLDLTGAGVSAVTVTNDNVTSGFDGNFSGVNFTGIETFQGLAGSTFTGDDVDSTWTINDGGASTYASLLRTATITGFNNLQGGSGKDTFNVVNNSTTANYSLKGGGGLDAFNFGSANKLDNITNPITVDGEAASATLTLNDQGNVTPFNYTAGATTIGRVGGGMVTYNAISDLTLNASNGNNIITATAMPSATGVITFNGGTGDDTLDVTAVNPVTVSQLAFTAVPSTTGFNGKVASGAASFNFTGVESIDAKSGTAGDKLIGMDAASTWTVDESAGNTSKYVNNALPARSLRFTGFDTLQGGTQVDTFNVLNNSLTATFSLQGGASLDAFNFGNGNTLDGITNPIAIDGEAASATLTLNDQGHNNPINYTVGANTIGRTGGGTVTYSNITALTLNASNGTNKIAVTGMPTATGPIVLNGGTGADTLDLTAAALNPVTVTLSQVTAPAATATGFDGTVASGGKSFNFTAVEKIDAPSGVGDELIGINIDATWTINDATGSSYLADLANPTPDRKLDWSGFEKLTGNSGKDTFKVQNNGTSNPLTLDGKAGADTFLIADGSNKLRPSSVIKSLSVIGNADAGDQLVVNDQDEAGDKDYSISATSVTVQEPGGVVISHNTVETIILNASQGLNKITVVDGAYAPPTTVKLVDTVGNSEIVVDDTADGAANTWTVSDSKVIRTLPAASMLTVDYTGDTKTTKLTLLGGTKVDDISVLSTRTGVATTVDGGPDNDIITVTPAGNLNALAGPLTVAGGANAADTRTVFKGGQKDVPSIYKFTATSTAKEKGDTLIVNDSAQAGFTTYTIDNANVTRTSAPTVTVKYSQIEQLKLQAGSGNSDIIANMPLLAATPLPTIVQIDGGNAALDNRFQVKGSTDGDEITIGDATTNESSRSQFEVTSVKRMWVEGRFGKDTIYNRTAGVPALLDGGEAKDATTNPALRNTAGANENDVIVSDAQGNFDYSSVLLGNDGSDFLLTRNNNTNNAILPTLPRMTSILIGDYFINTNVPFTSTNVAQRTNRLQVVNNPAAPVSFQNSGETGDRYITDHGSTVTARNYAIARLDTNADAFGPGKFENLSVDTTNLQVIQWLQGRLRVSVSPAGIAQQLAVANYYVRQFTRLPGSPISESPAFPNQTYNPGGKATVSTVADAAGGEFLEGATEQAAIVQNPFDAADVNGDGRITAFDALLIINELNLKGSHQIDTSSLTGNQQMLDVTGDSAVTAFDALNVINRLNTGATAAKNQDALASYFRELDQAELESTLVTDWATSPPANGLTDDALLALLAGDNSDDNAANDVLSF